HRRPHQVGQALEEPADPDDQGGAQGARAGARPAALLGHDRRGRGRAVARDRPDLIRSKVMASSGSLLVGIKALSANLAIATIKFIVAFLSGSAAMLAEAVHSLADSGNQVLLIVGLNRSQRAEDSRHEFGYGSEGYFWAFIVAISLFTMGATFSIYEGVEKI